MIEVRNSPAYLRIMAAALTAMCDLDTKLAAVLDAYPELGIAGFADTAPTKRPSVADVRRCLWYLALEPRRFPPGTNSYGLKHEVEHWGRREHPEENSYTPNGAMVAALLLVGTPVERRGINAVVLRDWTKAARRYALPGKTPPRRLRASNRETVVRKSENPDACRC